MADAGPFRRRDPGLVLAEPGAKAIGADEDKPADVPEGGIERCRLVEVGRAHRDAPCGEGCKRIRLPRGRDDAAGGNAEGIEEVMEDALAEVAGGAGDEKAFHGLALSLCGLKSRPWLK